RSPRAYGSSIEDRNANIGPPSFLIRRFRSMNSVDRVFAAALPFFSGIGLAPLGHLLSKLLASALEAPDIGKDWIASRDDFVARELVGEDILEELGTAAGEDDVRDIEGRANLVHQNRNELFGLGLAKLQMLRDVEGLAVEARIGTGPNRFLQDREITDLLADLPADCIGHCTNHCRHT